MAKKGNTWSPEQRRNFNRSVRLRRFRSLMDKADKKRKGLELTLLKFPEPKTLRERLTEAETLLAKIKHELGL